MEITYKININKHLKGGAKKGDWLGNLGTEECQNVSLLSFLFASYIPVLVLEKLATPKWQ